MGDAPISIFQLGRLRLLALGGWDPAFDAKGSAVGAGHSEAGGVASYLKASGLEVDSQQDEGAVAAGGLLFARGRSAVQ